MGYSMKHIKIHLRRLLPDFSLTNTQLAKGGYARLLKEDYIILYEHKTKTNTKIIRQTLQSIWKQRRYICR